MHQLQENANAGSRQQTRRVVELEDLSTNVKTNRSLSHGRNGFYFNMNFEDTHQYCSRRQDKFKQHVPPYKQAIAMDKPFSAVGYMFS